MNPSKASHELTMAALAPGPFRTACDAGWDWVSHVAGPEGFDALGGVLPVLVHEVRNYLGLTRARAQIIARGLSANPQQDAAWILGAIDRLDQALQRVMRLEASPSLECRPCSITALLQDVAGLFEPLAHQRRSTLIVESDVSITGSDLVELDADAMREVLVNLVQNAIEAMPAGGTVRLRACADADWVTISVEDEGPGIPPDVAARIFDPFYTTKQRGTGLGLAICRRIVEAHQGCIWFESRPGRGTTFFVRLPRCRRAV